jgi:AcrR family transcriptional regulator
MGPSTPVRSRVPRTKPPAERQADLLDAAQVVFVEKGVTAATLEDITSRAGVAKGTFYLHFRSKDDIVSALQRRFGERFAARMQAAVDAEEDWTGKLDALVEACFTNYAAEYDVHDVLFHHPGAYDEHGDAPSPPAIVAVVRGLLADGVAAGAFSVDDVELTAVFVFSALHGAFEASCHGPDRPAEARVVRTAQQLVRRAAGVRDA